MNPTRKRENIVRDIRKFKGKFTSIIDIKWKLMEEFDDQVLPLLHVSFGHFVGCQSMKKWLVTEDDLDANVPRAEASW